MDPQQGSQLANGLDKCKFLIGNKTMDIEGHGLHKGFEVLSNQPIAILDHVTSSKCGNSQAIKICGLQADGKCCPVIVRPMRVDDVPNIFDNPEQDCMQDLDWCILCRVQAWSGE